MKLRQDQGMTLIEVTIALTILLIGIGFIVKSDSVSYFYRAQHELRQQMIFYAAGLLEASVEGQTINQAQDPAPFNSFQVPPIVQTDATKDGTQNTPCWIAPADPAYHHVQLKMIQVKVSPSNTTDPNQTIILSTYRVINKG